MDLAEMKAFNLSLQAWWEVGEISTLGLLERSIEPSVAR